MPTHSLNPYVSINKERERERKKRRSWNKHQHSPVTGSAHSMDRLVWSSYQKTRMSTNRYVAPCTNTLFNYTLQCCAVINLLMLHNFWGEIWSMLRHLKHSVKFFFFFFPCELEKLSMLTFEAWIVIMVNLTCWNISMSALSLWTC